MPCNTHAGFEAAAYHAACMPVLKQQHAHAAAREVRNDNHQIPEKGSNSDKSRKGVERRKSRKWF
jgi:hypothetical protein